MTSSSASPVYDRVGVHVKGSPAGAMPAGEPERQWQPVECAPFGIPIEVRDAGGQQAMAIRDAYVGWFDEGRAGGLPFCPVEWR